MPRIAPPPGGAELAGQKLMACHHKFGQLEKISLRRAGSRIFFLQRDGWVGHKPSVDRECATGDPPALAVNLLLGAGTPLGHFYPRPFQNRAWIPDNIASELGSEAPETYVYD